MRVTILAQIDYAGSAYKLWEALRAHTDIDVDLYAGKHKNSLNHPSRHIITQLNKQAVQDRIDSSDIIHLKGDWPPSNNYLGLRLLHKPIITTTSGNFFRKKKNGGMERFTPIMFKKAAIRTSFEPDLLYPEYSGIWTPHPVDSEGKPNIWEPQETPLLLHMPTNRHKKNTSFIMDVLEHLAKKMLVEVRLIEKMTFAQALEARKRATIFFDQFKVGFYGNSAIEAMQYGIPVACYISPFARSRAPMLKDCPVISDNTLNPQTWMQLIRRTLQSDMRELSNKTKQWCDEVHSYRVIAAQWSKLYGSI